MTAFAVGFWGAIGVMFAFMAIQLILAFWRPLAVILALLVAILALIALTH